MESRSTPSPSGPGDGGAPDGGPDHDRPVALLLAPRDGVPPVVDTPTDLAATVRAFAAGSGPVAVDAERASGYRYGQRAYLVQLRRRGAGTALVDPIACPDLSALGAAIADAEWVLHAAAQDLPCLAGVGLRPTRLFDTELAGRLAGFERVGLGTIVERVLGLRLEKGHSAADWSRRPLPEPWLRYAALDVEVLVELRDALEAELLRQGKLGWAVEEFAAVLAAPAPPPRPEPWRRTSGIHRVRSRRQLAAIRALWEVRDALAAKRDLAPGRLLPDAALVSAATSTPRSLGALRTIPGFAGRAVKNHLDAFLTALDAVRSLADDDLPATGVGTDGPPPPGRWADRDPAAAERLTAARAAIAAIAEQHRLPVENLVAPEFVRRLAWEPPQPGTPHDVADALLTAGARGWQVDLTAAALAAALAAAPPDAPGVTPVPGDEPADEPAPTGTDER